ncbi:MAG: hypothetical protein KJZ87_17315 [Thermoguttaceae bacterium]|nr:hypothetical protein [Thermoguttaceae bacterium]
MHALLTGKQGAETHAVGIGWGQVGHGGSGRAAVGRRCLLSGGAPQSGGLGRRQAVLLRECDGPFRSRLGPLVHEDFHVHFQPRQSGRITSEESFEEPHGTPGVAPLAVVLGKVKGRHGIVGVVAQG